MEEKGGGWLFRMVVGSPFLPGLPKRHSGSVQFSRLRQVPLAIRQCFECIYGYVRLGLVLIKDIFIRNSLFCSNTYNSICETLCIVSNHKRRLVCISFKSHLLIASGEEAECKTMINRWNFLHKDIKHWRNGKTMINRCKKDIKQRRNCSLNLAVNIGICYAVN